jgi:hypothetical protein
LRSSSRVTPKELACSRGLDVAEQMRGKLSGPSCRRGLFEVRRLRRGEARRGEDESRGRLNRVLRLAGDECRSCLCVTDR